jgi:hypothetical protein
MTLPKDSGGLNITEISLQNQCLLLKWLWIAIKEPTSLWGSAISTLGISFTHDESTTNHNYNNRSHFIRELTSLLPMLRTSLTTDAQGTLLWGWTPNQLFSTNSMYRIFNDPGISRPQFQRLWTTNAPPRVLFLLWLLLHENSIRQKISGRKVGRQSHHVPSVLVTPRRRWTTSSLTVQRRHTLSYPPQPPHHNRPSPTLGPA